jgi:ferredoxin, 2Fe-2S
LAAITIHLDSAGAPRRSISGACGQSLMRAATAAGIDAIAADCGGVLSCATCHVVVAPEWAARLPAPGADEDAMLEMTAAPREPNSRLSCQIVLTPELDGLAVRVADTQY